MELDTISCINFTLEIVTSVIYFKQGNWSSSLVMFLFSVT